MGGRDVTLVFNGHTVFHAGKENALEADGVGGHTTA